MAIDDPSESVMAEDRRVFGSVSSAALAHFRAAKTEWSQRLLGAPTAQAARAFRAAIGPTPTQNVVGVGIGEKLVAGKSTGERAIKFLVRVKFPEGQVPDRDRLPNIIEGLPTDVEQVGFFRALSAAETSARRRKRPSTPIPTPPTTSNPRTRIRPAQPGCSVGFEIPGGLSVMAGTFGAVVKDQEGLYILSNNHVLANENQLPAGSPIFQPGLLDGGNTGKDKIAELARFILLVLGSPNTVDCAIAKVLDSTQVSSAVLTIGAPQGTAAAAIDMVVHKFGRTTNYRAGRVTSIDTDVSVSYEIGNLTFQEQIIIVGLNGQPFSDAGDSGSLILDRSSQNAVGLLFAGSPSHTIANHIESVLTALNVNLA